MQSNGRHETKTPRRIKIEKDCQGPKWRWLIQKHNAKGYIILVSYSMHWEQALFKLCTLVNIDSHHWNCIFRKKKQINEETTFFSNRRYVHEGEKLQGCAGQTFEDIERSALWRLDAREVRLAWSTEQGLLLFSIILFTTIPYSPYIEMANRLLCAFRDQSNTCD